MPYDQLDELIEPAVLAESAADEETREKKSSSSVPLSHSNRDNMMLMLVSDENMLGRSISGTAAAGTAGATPPSGAGAALGASAGVGRGHNVPAAASAGAITHAASGTSNNINAYSARIHR